MAVRAEVTTAVSELGLVADATGGGVVPGLGACAGCGLANHSLPVAAQLLLDTSGGREGKREGGKGRGKGGGGEGGRGWIRDRSQTLRSPVDCSRGRMAAV